MGTCCSSRTDKQDPKGEFSINPNSNTSLNGNNHSFKQSCDSNHIMNQTQDETINEAFKSNIDRLITSNPSLIIRIIDLNVIWNIMKHYRNDFTSSPYIIFDLREKNLKKENFIKLFKCINYSINEIEAFSEDRIETFKRYLNNKTVVVITQGDEIDQCNRFIQCALLFEIHLMSIAVLRPMIDSIGNLDNNNMIELYNAMDDRWFNCYPFVLFAMKAFYFLKGYCYFFIESISNWDNRNSNGNINLNHNGKGYIIEKANDDYKDDKYSAFINKFNIRIILRLHSEMYQEDMNYSLKDLIVFNFNINILIDTCTDTLTSDTRCNSDKNQLYQILETIKIHLLNQCSIVILYNDKSIDKKPLCVFLINLLYHLTYFKLNDLKMHLNHLCPFFIKEINDILLSINHQSIIPITISSSNSSSKQIEPNQSFETLLIKLKTEVNNKHQSIYCIIEKILLNILQYPNNELYRRIKCNSNTFKSTFDSSPNAKLILEAFGFEYGKDSIKGDYYSLTKAININELRRLYYSFINCIKKTRNDTETDLASSF